MSLEISFAVSDETQKLETRTLHKGDSFIHFVYLHNFCFQRNFILAASALLAAFFAINLKIYDSLKEHEKAGNKNLKKEKKLCKFLAK